MEYVGSELELFSLAKNWKSYYMGFLQPHIKGNVLEVGSGVGNNTALLLNPNVKRWVCLEPDEKLLEKSKKCIDDVRCQFKVGTLQDLRSEHFDTIIYIDVLEHIENDDDEIRNASGLLKSNGSLLILSPAHQVLFSPFDQAVGHFRRYNKKALKGLVKPYLECRKVFYLDSVGFFLSLANRVLLKQKLPSRNQICFWDRIVIPLSRCLDWLLIYRFGKTVFGVWQK